MQREAIWEAEGDVRVPRVEALLIGACHGVASGRALCTSLGWGQCAVSLARRLPQARVVCHFLDLHPLEQARHVAEDTAARVEWVCSTDLPAGPFDLAAIPVSRFGEAELTRDMLQDAYERLDEGGQLITAVDNPQDHWLHGELRKLLIKVTREAQRAGVVYRGVRHGPLERRRAFRCEFAFRDQGRLVRAVSRPGVFSHRRLDLGARALLEAMEVKAGDRVLDMGCGSGVVGLAAALRAPGVFVQAIDSNARAVDCTRQGAVLNGITVIDHEAALPGDSGRPAVGETARSGDRPQHRPGEPPQRDDGRQLGSAINVLLDAEGRVPQPGTFDLALGNPPYYSHYQIAEIFLQAARQALRPGGRVLIVTKKDEWHLARMRQLFESVQSRDVRGYRMVSGVQRGD